MNALLLAAGLGTRCKPFTLYTAKATLPLLNVPFIRYPLRYLHAYQVDEVVINLHAHPDSVRKAAGDQYGVMPIHYSYEPQILGTAGAIKKAAPLLGNDPFLVMNGDMLIDLPIEELLEQHMSSKAAVTLVIMDAEQFPSYTGLYFDTKTSPLALSGIRQQIGEKFHYAGIQMVSPEILNLIPENKRCEVFDEIYPELMKQGKVRGFIYDGLWLEIGTLRDYLATSLRLLQHTLPHHLQPLGMIGSTHSPTASIQDGAVVQNSILMENAVVTPGSVIDHCIIGPGARANGRLRNAAVCRGLLPWYF